MRSDESAVDMAQKSPAYNGRARIITEFLVLRRIPAIIFNFQDASIFSSNRHFQPIHILGFLFKRRMDIAIKRDLHAAMS